MFRREGGREGVCPGGVHSSNTLVAIVKQKEFASRCCSSLFVFCFILFYFLSSLSSMFPTDNNTEIDGIGFLFFLLLCVVSFSLLALSIGQRLCINFSVSRANLVTTLHSHLDDT